MYSPGISRVFGHRLGDLGLNRDWAPVRPGLSLGDLGFASHMERQLPDNAATRSGPAL